MYFVYDIIINKLFVANHSVWPIGDGAAVLISGYG